MAWCLSTRASVVTVHTHAFPAVYGWNLSPILVDVCSSKLWSLQWVIAVYMYVGCNYLSLQLIPASGTTHLNDTTNSFFQEKKMDGKITARKFTNIQALCWPIYCLGIILLAMFTQPRKCQLRVVFVWNDSLNLALISGLSVYSDRAEYIRTLMSGAGI